MTTKRVRIEGDLALMRDVEEYCAAHPHGAAAMRHPHIAIDHSRYVAYTGRSIKGGVLGFGTSIGSALHAFDDLYARTPGRETVDRAAAATRSNGVREASAIDMRSMGRARGLGSLIQSPFLMDALPRGHSAAGLCSKGRLANRG
jgi:hypothetical protein